MSKKTIRIILLSVFIVAIVGATVVYIMYKSIFIEPAANRNQAISLYIPTGSNYDQLRDSVLANQLVEDTALFDRVAKMKKLKNNVHAGHYRLPPNISLNRMINIFTGGLQEPVKVSFHNIRKLEQMAGKVSHQLELDSSRLMNLLQNPDFMQSINPNSLDLLAFFIPNTYEFYWNTSAEEFLERMKKEYDRFWNNKRKEKAKAINLTAEEVSTLASIVQEETNQHSEMDRIAGVYINRLKINMLLQADPTLKYAWNNWAMRRVLNRHKAIDSPYNTYKFAGLPPGPISMPEPQVIDKVLNYERHDYYYFVASTDKPGFHDFSRSLREHNNKANRYRRNLNRRGIYN
jgi:UPF0755 protein